MITEEQINNLLKYVNNKKRALDNGTLNDTTTSLDLCLEGYENSKKLLLSFLCASDIPFIVDGSKVTYTMSDKIITIDNTTFDLEIVEL